MSPICASPDPSQGTAWRLASYLDCQAKVLGENGFQSLASYSMTTGILSSLIAIFVAIFAYRLIFRGLPEIHQGMSLFVRLGFVIALISAWPAAQTLFYRVAVDGPQELTSVVAPQVGLPVSDIGRVQTAYDTMRLGTTPSAAPPTTSDAEEVKRETGQNDRRQQQMLAAMPNTSVLFLVGAIGIGSIFKLLVGFLLAIGPIAILAVLFDRSIGLAVGWFRSLIGCALATFGIGLSSSIELKAVEAELEQLGSASQIFQTDIDYNGIATIAILFAIAALMIGYISIQLSKGLIWQLPQMLKLHRSRQFEHKSENPWTDPATLYRPRLITEARSPAEQLDYTQIRNQSVVDSLKTTMRREEATAALATERLVLEGTTAHYQPSVKIDAVETGIIPKTQITSRSQSRTTRQSRNRDKLA